METNRKRDESYADAITAAVSVILNEKIALSRLEDFFSPKPAELGQDDESRRNIEQRLDRLSQGFGGPPRTITRHEYEEKPCCDIYLKAAISELLSVFHRTRRAVSRAQMFLVVLGANDQMPQLIEAAFKTPGATEVYLPRIQEAFWENAETAYIRLGSYWDRVGQVLDFVFFRIRQYERDGFPAVMDRIHNNIIPVNPSLLSSSAWNNLREYQISEKRDGLKWLLRRRNLIIHSLHLQPIPNNSESEELYYSMFNHLEEKLMKKMRPETPPEEVLLLNSHLSIAASLFQAAISLCEWWMEIKNDGVH